MRLDWFKHIEKVLQLDPSYSMNHITAHHTLSSQLAPTNVIHVNQAIIKNGVTINLPSQKLKPNYSMKFRAHVILKKLKVSFKTAWKSTIGNSSRLKFYDQLKHEFGKEGYLDEVSKFKDRSNLTKLRISAHRLEIELGRRNNTISSNRICKSCHITTGESVVEDEQHLITQCDLNAKLRHTATTKLNSISTLNSYNQSPNQGLTHLANLGNIGPTTTSEDKEADLRNRTYTYRIVASFVTKSFSNRETFLKSATNSTRNQIQSSQQVLSE